ncbi:S9 family peptidase [candidate division KSB1 bacterium]|nr:S9 family peptidase [candidate division KSB1 bacterium]
MKSTSHLKFSFLFILILGLLISPRLTYTQEEVFPALTLENIFSGGLLRTKGYRSVHFLKGVDAYITLERAVDGSGSELIQTDCRTGEQKSYVTIKELTPAAGKEPLMLNEYSWSADEQKLLIFTNTKRVWRYNTRGDYWIFDLKTRQLNQIGRVLVPGSLMFAKISPDGKKVSYVYQQNLYVESLESGAIQQLTFDGAGNLINGTFDWAYEEEFDCRDGFRWSPDSKYLAYWQINSEGIGTFYMVNNLDSIYAKLIPVPYPKVGTVIASARIGVISIDGGETRWFDIPGDPRAHYLPRMDFIPNSDEIIMQQLNRLQNTDVVFRANIHTGVIQPILTEKDNAWVDIVNNISWIQKNKYFTWLSERDGWRHIYLVSRDGQEIKKITHGDYDVLQIESIDDKSGYIYFIASPESPIQRYLYRCRLNGKEKAERVSPKELSGHHSYSISPNNKWALHRFGNAVTPTIINFISLPDHKIRRVLEGNKEARQKTNELGLSPKEFFRININDSTALDAYMIKPREFDPSKKYPVIFNIYGEPAGTTVQDSWSGNLYSHFLTQKGYIIMSVDNRGTNVPRGRSWRKCIYRQVGILATQDQAAAVRKIVERFNFIDPDRIGVWGWSGGGSMTLNCMFRYPEIYKTGIAVAFVADQRLYDAIYQERYMGLPDDNAAGYKDGSPITHAHRLQGNLLLIHGSADDNVHYQNCELLINELIKHKKQFTMMQYPMRSHSIYERENTTMHLYELMTNFWEKNLPGGGK